MIEEALMNYGVLGLWTLVLLYNTQKYQNDMKALIKNNTEAFIKVYEVIKSCPNKSA